MTLGVRLGGDIHTFATVAVYLLTNMSSRTPPRRGTPNTRIVAVCLNTVLDITIEQYNTVHCNSSVWLLEDLRVGVFGVHSIDECLIHCEQI